MEKIIFIWRDTKNWGGNSPPCPPGLLLSSQAMIFNTGYYKDKRIIITGASQGIGKDLAIRLAQLGSRYGDHVTC